MCNVYVPPEKVDIEEIWQAQFPGPEQLPLVFAYVAPLKDGPYVLPQGRAQVGQWGMIPNDSATRIPKTAKGARLSTNNARRETLAKSWTFGPSWRTGRRCLIPAATFQEPYWGPLEAPFAKSIPWHFARADGTPWALAGLYSEWTDLATGEVVSNYTMITQNCDSHPLLKLMHKPERDKLGNILPAAQQDKRTPVPIEQERWDEWLHGTIEQAEALIQVPDLCVYKHQAVDPAQHIELPVRG